MVPSPTPLLTDGCAAKLASPDHQGVFQEPTPFEIGEQCGHRAVGCAAHPLVVCVDIIMSIPLPGHGTAAGVELYKTDAALDQSTRDQAACAKLGRARIIEPIKGAGLSGFA